MGVTDSKLHSSESVSADGITTVVDKAEEIDLHLEKLQRLEIAAPILKLVAVESSLKDLLLRRSLSQAHSGEHGSLDPATTATLLTLYHEWQRATAEKINKNQEDLGNKIDIVEALAMKLLQRFKFSLCIMKACATDLEDVHALKVEVGDMKGKLREVLENYSTLHKRINAEGPDFLKAVVRPFSMNDMNKRDHMLQKASSC